jgi:tetratricopeptide (TPR) repeat protein
MTHYVRAWALHRAGEPERVRLVLQNLPADRDDYFFPSRIQEQTVLEWVASEFAEDATARYGLGNYCFHNDRVREAIAWWEACIAIPGAPAQAFRNLGIAYWNDRRDAEAAVRMYREAVERSPSDARLVTELAQLLGRTGTPADERLALLESFLDLVLSRDDAVVELASLYNQTGRPERALELCTNRSFHPWEGGEGTVLRQYVDAHLALGRAALAADNPDEALAHFEQALETPDALGEKFHPLQAKADVLFLQGEALSAAGNEAAARERFQAAASEQGDFEQMAVTEYSELTIYRARALAALGRKDEAVELVTAMKEYAAREISVPAKIDYFATSLPALLVFDEDLDASKRARMERYIELCDEFLGEQLG